MKHVKKIGGIRFRQRGIPKKGEKKRKKHQGVAFGPWEERKQGKKKKEKKCKKVSTIKEGTSLLSLGGAEGKTEALRVPPAHWVLRRDREKKKGERGRGSKSLTEKKKKNRGGGGREGGGAPGERRNTSHGTQRKGPYNPFSVKLGGQLGGRRG